MGGDSGLPIVLQGLKDALFSGQECHPSEQDRGHLAGIVTVADDGGSSGRLRRAYVVPPPGDIRNCLLALADGDSTLAALNAMSGAAVVSPDVELLRALGYRPVQRDLLAVGPRARHDTHKLATAILEFAREMPL